MKIVSLIVQDDDGNVEVHAYPGGYRTVRGSLKVDSKFYKELSDPKFKVFVKKTLK